jgi:hypothetical protein
MNLEAGSDKVRLGCKVNYLEEVGNDLIEK